MKKLLVMTLMLGAVLLGACADSKAAEPSEVTVPTAAEASSEPNTEPSNAAEEKPSLVATSFHEYDWLKQILGEEAAHFEITLLMDTGVDLHSYEPSVADIATIAAADLFIYNGGLSHDWVADVLAQPLHPDLRAINVMESLGEAVKMEVTVEGMQGASSPHAHDDHEHGATDHDDHNHDAEATAEHDHDHEAEAAAEHNHDHDYDHDHDHEAEADEHAGHSGAHTDEHVWLSLNNAMLICELIASELAAINPDKADIYQKNAQNYSQSLQDLDAAYHSTIAAAARDTIVFADRFPFLYMMADYDLNYYAAFQGCSAETEATFETITFLAEKVNELDINKLLIIDNGLTELAATVNSSSQDQDSQTLVLHSLQSVNQEQIDSGLTYLDIMTENLAILEQALAE